MRQEVLKYLLAHQGEFVSGQKISDALGISRTAVWKHIRLLKKRGYVIEAFTKKGYCLKEAPQLLSVEAIQKGLKTKCLGQHLVYLEKTGSTNTVAKKLAADGAPEGTVVVAEEQTGGHGRLVRSFLSPFARGLWFSLILRPDFPPMEVSKMTLLAAVALCKAMRAQGLTDCGIKWPNDILVHGKKISGILTELNASVEKINYIIMGIGINTGLTEKDLTGDLQQTATSFLLEGIQVDRAALLQGALKELEKGYDTAKKKGFAPILKEWKNLSCMLGADVTVTAINRSFTGQAVDLDDDGNLLVQTKDGLEKVLAGDIHVRPAQQGK